MAQLSSLNFEAALYIKAGIPVFCPIAHSHPIAVHGAVDAFDHDIWRPADRPMMNAAVGLIVVRMESWEQSRGIAMEIEAFRAAGKPIVYTEPGVFVGPGELEAAEAAPSREVLI